MQSLESLPAASINMGVQQKGDDWRYKFHSLEYIFHCIYKKKVFGWMTLASQICTLTQN